MGEVVILEDDLRILTEWLSVLSKPLGRVDIEDYSAYNAVAIKRCIDILERDGAINSPSATQPNIYFAVHSLESGKMPTIDYYKAIYEAQMKKSQVEELSLKKLELEIVDLKERPKVNRATIWAAWIALLISLAGVFLQVFSA